MNRSIPELQNPFLRLRAGCYQICFVPARPYHGPDDNPDDIERQVREYAGTLRVVHYDATAREGAIRLADTHDATAPRTLRISGDLYAVPETTPSPVNDFIPIFPIADYRFHLLGEKITETENGGFHLQIASTELRYGEWRKPTTVVLSLRWREPLSKTPSVYDVLEGEVLDTQGEFIGNFEMAWISPWLRRAIVELDAIEGIEPPLDTGVEVTVDPLTGVRVKCNWDAAFAPCGWQISLPQSDQPAEPATKVWSEHELQQAMPALRDTTDNDSEWRYHLFCVGEIEERGRGFMFQVRGTQPDSRLVESAVLAARYVFPPNEGWGELEGRELSQTPLYFRTAVHEVGHSMGLAHNSSSVGFMAPTESIKQVALEKAKGNGSDLIGSIEWQFAPEDQERLRHWPDVVVRPAGGAPLLPLPGLDDPVSERTSNGAKLAEHLKLTITPLNDQVPLGAPVRFDLKLENTGSTEALVPSLRIKDGYVAGHVAHDGIKRYFLPVSRLIDDRLTRLKPGQVIQGSLSLLRGPDGALFPEPGAYQVVVTLDWFVGAQALHLHERVAVSVLSVVDEQHYKVARRLIDTTDTLASFAIGGDGFAEGNQAINVALTNPVLAPHFAVIRLRRLIRDYGTIPGCLDRVLEILGDKSPNRVILCQEELCRLATLLQSVEGRRSGMTLPDIVRLAFRVIFGRPSDQTLELLFADTLNPATARAARLPVTSSRRQERNAPQIAPPPQIPGAAWLTRLTATWNADLQPARSTAASKPARTRRATRNGRHVDPGAAAQLREHAMRAGLPLDTLRNVLKRFEAAESDDSRIRQAGKALVEAFQWNAPTAASFPSSAIHQALLANLIANLVIVGTPGMDEVLANTLSGNATTNVMDWIMRNVIPDLMADLPDKLNLASGAAQSLVRERLTHYRRELLEKRTAAFLSYLRSDPLTAEERDRVEQVIAQSRVEESPQGLPAAVAA